MTATRVKIFYCCGYCFFLYMYKSFKVLSEWKFCLFFFFEKKMRIDEEEEVVPVFVLYYFFFILKSMSWFGLMIKIVEQNYMIIYSCAKCCKKLNHLVRINMDNNHLCNRWFDLTKSYKAQYWLIITFEIERFPFF